MSPVLFVTMLGTAFAFLLLAGFKLLPKEEWQILVAVPLSKSAGGSWNGVNLTYYGFLVASAEVFAIMTATALMVSSGISLGVAVALILIVVSLCAPAAGWVARIVEGRSNSFTVSGSVAVGMETLPFAIWMLARLGYGLSTAVLFSSMASG